MHARGIRKWAASVAVLLIGYAAATPYSRTPPSDSDLLDEQVPLHLSDTGELAGTGRFTPGQMLDPVQPARPVVVQKARPEPAGPATSQLSEIPSPRPPAMQDQFPDPPADLPRVAPSLVKRPAVRQTAAEDPEAARRTHRIRDGDTLKLLAARYLGNSARHLELYEANRHVLPSPEILPLDVEIIIPHEARPVSSRQPRGRWSGGARPPNPLPHEGLAPVPL